MRSSSSAHLRARVLGAYRTLSATPATRPRLLCLFSNCLSRFHRNGKRLFDNDVLTRRQRVKGDLMVERNRCQNQDGVDQVGVEHVVPVLEDLRHDVLMYVAHVDVGRSERVRLVGGGRGSRRRTVAAPSEHRCVIGAART